MGSVLWHKRLCYRGLTSSILTVRALPANTAHSPNVGLMSAASFIGLQGLILHLSSNTNQSVICDILVAGSWCEKNARISHAVLKITGCNDHSRPVNILVWCPFGPFIYRFLCLCSGASECIMFSSGSLSIHPAVCPSVILVCHVVSKPAAFITSIKLVTYSLFRNK